MCACGSQISDAKKMRKMKRKMTLPKFAEVVHIASGRGNVRCIGIGLDWMY